MTELSAGDRLWKTARDSELFVVDTKYQELWCIVCRQEENQELWFVEQLDWNCVC
jgi:hypothetical protein